MDVRIVEDPARVVADLLVDVACAGGHVALAGGSPGRCQEAADAVERALDARFPQGVRYERRLASWADLEALG